MRTNNILATIALCLFIGNQMPKIHWSASVDAAPKDVVGSPNVAVDTYRNSKGSFVLFSDGRIIRSSGGSQDLGAPYTAPPSGIAKADAQGDRPKGSPNVAVKALVRGEGTLILFADGSLKKPNNADAAAGGAEGQKIVYGITDGTGVTSDGAKVGSITTGGKLTIAFNEAFTETPTIILTPVYSGLGAASPNPAPQVYPINITPNSFSYETFTPGVSGGGGPGVGTIHFVAVGK